MNSPKIGSTPSKLIFGACLVMAVVFAVYPAVRCFTHVELSYNEGWNVYNAQTVAAGRQLYPAHPGWSVVNYPALSFIVFAVLHSLTGHWLLPGRLISLASAFACAAMAGTLLRSMGASRSAAWLGGAFALLVLCISATAYVGVDDPQMFAEAIFMLGFLLYVRRSRTIPTIGHIALVSFVFVVAGCIKHSPLEFPFAVLLDLLLLSVASAGWFTLCSLVWAAVAVALNIHFGGPGFIQALILQRSFSPAKSIGMFWNLFGPLLIPLCISIWISVRLRHDPKQRILALLLTTGLIVGFYFEGGAGVSVNVWFGAMLAVAMLAGWAIHLSPSWPVLQRRPATFAAVLFAWMFIPALTENVWDPMAKLRQLHAESVRYQQEISILRQHPGPALCESLLRCEQAGKPYLYDPFNATRLMNSGTLSQQPLLDALRLHQYAAVQMHALPPGDDQTRERFPGAVMDSIQRYYRPVLTNEDGVILLPAK